jgi:hypothetical protein
VQRHGRSSLAHVPKCGDAWRSEIVEAVTHSCEWVGRRKRRPVSCRGEVREFGELVHCFPFALSGEQVVGEVFRPLLVSKLRLDVTPRGLDGVGMIPS